MNIIDKLESSKKLIRQPKITKPFYIYNKATIKIFLEKGIIQEVNGRYFGKYTGREYFENERMEE